MFRKTLYTFCLFALLRTASGQTVEPYTVKGSVTDAQGQPLANVQVFADNTLYYNTNAIGITDENGFYSIDVREPMGTWHMSAQLETQYQGENYTFSLHPDNDNPFSGTDGAIRNFEWRLSGETPQGFYYGAVMWVYADFSDFSLLVENMENVEITLTPDGPLIDGSTGEMIVHQGTYLEDIPVGRYTVTARYLPEGNPLLVRLRDTGEYTASVTALIKKNQMSELMLELQVISPSSGN
jgi:Carboxypeptidase regulatory-like domain